MAFISLLLGIKKKKESSAFLHICSVTHACTHLARSDTAAAAPEQQSVSVTLSRHSAASATGDKAMFPFVTAHKNCTTLLGLLKVAFDFYCRGNKRHAGGCTDRKSAAWRMSCWNVTRFRLSVNCPLLSFLSTDCALCYRWVFHQSAPSYLVISPTGNALMLLGLQYFAVRM